MSRAERDMGADAGGVRLWRDPVGVFVQDSVFGQATHIAYPAAQAAAMEMVVRDAVAWGKANNGWIDGSASSNVPSKRLKASVDTYLATLPRAHGGEGGG